MNGETQTIEHKKSRMSLFQKIVTGLFILVVLFVFYVTLDANKYRATVLVIEGQGKVGVNPTTESLDFGDLSRGASAVRTVDLQNGTFMPMYVLVWNMGDIDDLMEINESAFRLAPRSGTKISFTTYIPASAEIGRKYDGRVYIFRIPTFGL